MFPFQSIPLSSSLCWRYKSFEKRVHAQGEIDHAPFPVRHCSYPSRFSGESGYRMATSLSAYGCRPCHFFAHGFAWLRARMKLMVHRCFTSSTAIIKRARKRTHMCAPGAPEMTQLPPSPWAFGRSAATRGYHSCEGESGLTPSTRFKGSVQ